MSPPPEERNVQLVVNVSDAKTSATVDDVLVTYSLGSCIGVALYDPVARLAGLLHYQLPTSTLDPQRARENPRMFADTGMQVLLEEMESRGGQRRRMKVKLAGAAQMLNDANLFNIGKRNHTAIRKLLWQYGMFIAAEEIGGAIPRTMYLRAADGGVTIRSQQQTKEM
jgi:chemotaxis protein CheD